MLVIFCLFFFNIFTPFMDIYNCCYLLQTAAIANGDVRNRVWLMPLAIKGFKYKCRGLRPLRVVRAYGAR